MTLWQQEVKTHLFRDDKMVPTRWDHLLHGTTTAVSFWRPPGHTLSSLACFFFWPKWELKAVKRKISGRTLQMHYSVCTSEQPTCKRLHSPHIRGTQDTLTIFYDAGRELTVRNTSQDQLGQDNGVHQEGQASAWEVDTL